LHELEFGGALDCTATGSDGRRAGEVDIACGLLDAVWEDEGNSLLDS